MTSRKTAILAAAATYIGTVVGAGFASGQEVLQFFGLLGPWGLPAIAIAAAGFYYFGDIIMDTGRVLRAGSHLPVLREVSGRLAPVLDVVTTFFLFGALSAMVAGAGSVLYQEFSVPWMAGASLMAFASIVTVLFGLRGVIAAVSAVVPFLIGGVLIVSLAVLSSGGLLLQAPPPGFVPAVRPWPLSGVTYISYNIIMSVPVLASLGGTMKTRKEAGWSAALGAAGLGLSLLLVYLALVSRFPTVLGYEIPMAYLAATVHRFGGPFYTLIFLAEVYTTAVANLYGFTTRLASPGSNRFTLVAVLSGALSIWAASAGFAKLVRVVYPAVGWAGLALLLALVIYAYRTPVRPVTSRRRRSGR